ncbi:MAG: hypothetical protein RLZZ385_2250 [Pseudomonadota bacterium]
MSQPGGQSAPVYTWIDDDDGLQGLCRDWANQPALALDTEFVRTNTFYPGVGLLQVADPGGVYLLDPVTIGQWRDFGAIIGDAGRTLVLHSCSEDLNLLQHFLKTLPGRLFDTQRAAAFLGYGYSISYQALVAAELELTVDKGETRSDWMRRPLSDDQKHYAALDVAYLLPLQQRLQANLAAKGMLDWFEDDCRNLLQAVKDDDDELEWARYYRQVGGAWRLNRVQLQALQRLCFWREKKAREWDRPRSWILKDLDLLALATLAKQRPVTKDMLKQGTELNDKQIARHGETLLNCINGDQQFADIPDPEDFSKPLTPVWRKRLKQAQQLVIQMAEKIDVAPELLVRKRHLLELIDNLLARHDDPWPADLDNWRRPLLELPLLAALGQGQAEEENEKER